MLALEASFNRQSIRKYTGAPVDELQARGGFMTNRTRRNSAGLLRPLLAAGLLIAASGGASAAEAGEVRAGQALAIKACSPCHVESQPVGPPFAEIAKAPARRLSRCEISCAPPTWT